MSHPHFAADRLGSRRLLQAPPDSPRQPRRSLFAYISLLRFFKTFKNSVVVLVRSISNSNAEKDLYQMRKLGHENLLTVHEIFDFDSSFYIVSERMHTTLDHVIASAAYPKEAELASKVWQVKACGLPYKCQA
jgi:hypothetical protein